MEHDVMKRRKRPDRAVKLQERRDLSETVVKCSLKKLLRGDQKNEIMEAVEKRVQQCSLRTWKASLAVNLVVKELFNNIDNMEGVTVPDLWDTTFLRQLMLGTKGAILPNNIVLDIHSRYPSLLVEGERFLGDRNIYSAAAIKLSTNIKNHLVTNFPKLLKKYLYNTLPKEDAVFALFRVHGWKTQGSPAADNVSYRLRSLLGLLEGEQVDKAWFKDKNNLSAMLKLVVFVNRDLEARGLPTYNVLPVCRIKPHFITVDSSVMFGILKEVGVLQSTKFGLEDEQWGSVLDTEMIKGRGKTFTKTIETDGLVVNVHFTRPKRLTGCKPPSLEGKRVIGVDPGRTNIFFMAEEVKTGKGKSVFKTCKFTRYQYYVESGIFKARRRTKHWSKDLKEELVAMSGVSPKGCSLDRYMLYLQTVLGLEEKLWEDAFKMRWRDLRFRLYGGKKRSFAKFFNRLGDPKDIVLAYGAAKFAPGGRGELSVPTSRAFKECSYRFPIVPVDEFRTTKVCWKDNSVLEKVGKYGEDGKLVTVRGLLWCRSTIKGESKFVNRDVNASINILRCAVLPKRPSILERKNATSALKQPIGKMICW